MHVQFERLNGFWVESYFGISVISLIDQKCCDGLVDVDLDLSKLGISLDSHIFDDVLIEILVIKSNV